MSFDTSLIGCDAALAVESVTALTGRIRTITLFELPTVLPLQQRAKLNRGEQDIVRRALAMRQKNHVPFWDAAMLSSFDVPQVPVNLLEAAMLHNSQKTRKHRIPCIGSVADDIRNLIRTGSGGRPLVLSSRVRLVDGSTAHIPMLDFHCFESSRNSRLVSAVLNRLGFSRGLILRSGKSYHAYGAELLSQKSFEQFLARALLFCPIIDRAWVSHQLIEGAAALRISGRVDGTDIPKVIKVI